MRVSVLSAVLAVSSLPLWSSGPSSAANSPVNQVFQFMHAGAYSGWADGSTTHATSYLWIPKRCQRLRGLLILCQNVPEHMLVGHPAIRDVCARNDLGIVWSTPSFWYSKGQKEYGHIVDFSAAAARWPRGSFGLAGGRHCTLAADG